MLKKKLPKSSSAPAIRKMGRTYEHDRFPGERRGRETVLRCPGGFTGQLLPVEESRGESFEFCHFEEHTRREIFTISDISRFLPSVEMTLLTVFQSSR